MTSVASRPSTQRPQPAYETKPATFGRARSTRGNRDDNLRSFEVLSIRSELGRCKINNGGCWHDSRNGHAFSTCSDNGGVNYQCPPRFKGDGVKSCEEKKACQCPECSCKNTWGSYDCSCNGCLLYIRDHDTCVSKTACEGRSTWAVFWFIIIGLALAASEGYLVYKHRIRTYMDSEIGAIMAQHMPLDSQAEVPIHVSDEIA